MDGQDFGHLPLGSTPLLTFTFTTNGTPTDPAGVICNLTPPGGARTAQTLTHSGTGVYTLTVSCTTEGRWTGTVYATSGNQEPKTFAFTVDPDPNYP